MYVVDLNPSLYLLFSMAVELKHVKGFLYFNFNKHDKICIKIGD